MLLVSHIRLGSNASGVEESRDLLGRESHRDIDMRDTPFSQKDRYSPSRTLFVLMVVDLEIIGQLEKGLSLVFPV